MHHQPHLRGSCSLCQRNSPWQPPHIAQRWFSATSPTSSSRQRGRNMISLKSRRSRPISPRLAYLVGSLGCFSNLARGNYSVRSPYPEIRMELFCSMSPGQYWRFRLKGKVIRSLINLELRVTVWCTVTRIRNNLIKTYMPLTLQMFDTPLRKLSNCLSQVYH